MKTFLLLMLQMSSSADQKTKTSAATALQLWSVAPLFKTYKFEISPNQVLTVIKFTLIKEEIYVCLGDVAFLFLGNRKMGDSFAKIMEKDLYEVKRLDSMGFCEKHNECTTTVHQLPWNTLIATTSDACCFLETFNPNPSQLIHSISLAAKMALSRF